MSDSYSSDQRIVKGLSILALVVAIVSLAFAALMVAGASNVSAELGGAKAGAQAGYIMAVVSVFELIVALLGLHGAKHPEKLGLFTVLAGIIAVVNVIEAVFVFLQGAGNEWVNLIYAAVAFTAAWHAHRAKVSVR